MEKKKGNGLVVFLLIVMLVMGGFILYDKILKEKYFSNNTNEVKDDDNEKEENITERESADKKDADELYQEYLENLKKNIDKTYQSIPSDTDEYEFSKNHNEYNYGGISSTCAVEEIEGTKSCVELTDGKLSINITNSDETNKQFNIDQNVLEYFLVEEGNAGFHYLYYIKENGKLYMSDVEALLSSNTKPKETNLKNIVGVIPSSFGFISGWGQAIFVDIEGNLYRLDENQKATEL